MSNLASRRRELADTIDEYDAIIADQNESKRDTFVCYRADLEKEGMAKDAIKLELAALKAAIRKRQKARKDAGAVEEQDALAEEILSQIKNGTPDATHMRGARGDA